MLDHLGDNLKTNTSKYQILIKDASKPFSVNDLKEEPDPTTGQNRFVPCTAAAVERWFDTKDERDFFLMQVENIVQKVKGNFVHNKQMSSFYFTVFDIYDHTMRKLYSLTVYI